MVEVELRQGTEADVPFLLHSWLRSYRHSPSMREVDTDIYYRHYHAIVSNCLERAKVWVAVLPDAEDTILGWSAFEGNVLHYVYVKQKFRRMGIGRKLLCACVGIDYFTHKTGPGAGLVKELGAKEPAQKGLGRLNARYCPWLI